MLMDSMRALLGGSLYEWFVQMGQLLEGLWNSLLAWRIFSLLLLLCLIGSHYRRPK
ncbi:hypothetical protein Pcar_2702 [Syntrophotalea carbinolica DSM 2380]|uniref:Uncharacterized protein n=1 Tax=Syntrophotalea carbinolica (strain DSM 2380 / NBRC 103641 / GraBd1) TaxID=338963 RepID=Q3A119_SYNC1|nr:hypothetical protein [Syntrophotalea carbinolica]ABA89938.2 hypothetical protein Pcar_2702 [Syntrophotalea carbinolica DSM 2380]